MIPILNEFQGNVGELQLRADADTLKLWLWSGNLQEIYQMLMHNYLIIIHRATSRLKSNKML